MKLIQTTKRPPVAASLPFKQTRIKVRRSAKRILFIGWCIAITVAVVLVLILFVHVNKMLIETASNL